MSDARHARHRSAIRDNVAPARRHSPLPSASCSAAPIRLATGHQAALLITAALILTLLSGCGERRRGRSSGRSMPPRKMNDIVREIEQNAARLNRAIWSNSVHVTAQMVDNRGKKHSFSFDGSLLYQKPRMLRMDFRHGLGSQVMQIGSNDSEYWAWILPEMEQMWWGHHHNAGRPCVESISVRPDQMVSALGAGGLPTGGEGLKGPLRTAGKEFDILYYTRPDQNGDEKIVRQYYVDRLPPYQIRLIAFLDDMGQKEMTAYLDDYRPAWKGGPEIAHAYSIFWQKDRGRLKLKIDRITGKDASEIAPGVFVRPEGRDLPARIRDHVEQVDAACD